MALSVWWVNMRKPIRIPRGVGESDSTVIHVFDFFLDAAVRIYCVD